MRLSKTVINWKIRRVQYVQRNLSRESNIASYNIVPSPAAVVQVSLLSVFDLWYSTDYVTLMLYRYRAHVNSSGLNRLTSSRVGRQLSYWRYHNQTSIRLYSFINASYLY